VKYIIRKVGLHWWVTIYNTKTDYWTEHEFSQWKDAIHFVDLMSMFYGR